MPWRLWLLSASALGGLLRAPTPEASTASFVLVVNASNTTNNVDMSAFEQNAPEVVYQFVDGRDHAVKPTFAEKILAKLAEEELAKNAPKQASGPTLAEVELFHAPIPSAAQCQDKLGMQMRFQKATNTKVVTGSGVHTTIQKPSAATMGGPGMGGAPDGLMVFMHYHKTGCVFTANALDLLHRSLGGGEMVHIQNASSQPFSNGMHQDGSATKGFLEATYGLPTDVMSADPRAPSADKMLRGGAVRYLRVSNPGLYWTPPPPSSLRPVVNMVHWVRDPVALILSGYRYHMGEESSEAWEASLRVCHNCDAEAWKLIFAECDYRCGYYTLLNAVEEDVGVILEALEERAMLEVMMGNVAKWMNDPGVLQLSAEHLKRDFSGTMSCMIKFLKVSPADQPLLLQKFNTMDVYSAQHARHVEMNRHVTEGKYDNRALRTKLENHPKWGSEFTAARQLMVKIFERQQRDYGCPMPIFE